MLARALHLVWCSVGPRYLTRNYRKLPSSIVRNPASYHDAPTVLIASLRAVRVLTAIRSLNCSRGRGNLGFRLAVSGLIGFAFHSISVICFSKRVPRYRVGTLRVDSVLSTSIVASSEELIWGDVASSAAGVGRLFRSVSGLVGFAAIHKSSGTWMNVIHMGAFSLLCRIVEHRLGFVPALVVHSVYNLAVEADSSTGSRRWRSRG